MPLRVRTVPLAPLSGAFVGVFGVFFTVGPVRVVPTTAGRIITVVYSTALSLVALIHLTDWLGLRDDMRPVEFA